MLPLWDPGRGLAVSSRLPVTIPSMNECMGDAARALQLSQLLLGQVLMLADGDSAGFLYRQLPFLASLERKDGKATAYVCSNFTCSLPVTSLQELCGMLCP